MNWRSAYSQVVFVGLLAFCCPGMFNALTGLGKAGGTNEKVGNTATATLYGFFAFFGYFGGAFFNLFGNKVLMLVGGSTYAIYAAGVYIAGNVDGAEFVAIISGAILGFGAGWFWTAQGAMMMSYATPEKKGSYITIFWALFNLGGMFGGFLTMGINWNTDKDEANAASYFVFVGIMCVGAFGALFLAPAESVIREDGEPVVFNKASSAKEEIMGALMVVTNKHMLLLTPLFLASNWFYAYQFNAVNGSLFTIRTRGFNAAFYWGFQMLGAWIIGKVCDMKGKSVIKRAWLGFLTFAAMMNIAFIMGAFLQYVWHPDGVWDKVWNDETDKFDGPFSGADLVDLTDSSMAAFPIITYLCYGLGDAMLQSFSYWLMGALAGDDSSLAARYAGYYKGVQSLGACVSWVLDLYLKYVPQFWICWAMLVISLPFIGLAIRTLPETAAPTKSMSHLDNVNDDGGARPDNAMTPLGNQQQKGSADFDKAVDDIATREM